MAFLPSCNNLYGAYIIRVKRVEVPEVIYAYIILVTLYFNIALS